MSKLRGSDWVELARVIWPNSGKIRKDWPERWARAVEQARGEGISRDKRKARVDSPVWKIMASIYPDGTGNSEPPFAINSGMGWKTESGDLLHPLVPSEEQDEELDEEVLQLP